MRGALATKQSSPCLLNSGLLRFARNDVEGAERTYLRANRFDIVAVGIDQVPEMARGRGVRLQKYKGGGLSDVTTFDSKAGLTWKDSAGRDQSMSWKELTDWRGNRADAGRLAHGLPKSNKFGRGVE